MMKNIILLCFLILPLFTFSQDKKTMKRLEAQVKLAKEQEAAARKKQENENEKNLSATKIGAQFLPFHMVDANHQFFTDQDLPKDKPILLVLFNPMCDHCQKVAKAITDNKQRFNDVSILFVCGMNLLEEIPNFITQSAIVDFPNFKVCASNEEYTAQIFESKGIPQIMMYSKDRVLQKIMYETIDIDLAMSHLSK
jgi:thiol-disulfide isomerase/thioredoxin